MAFVASTPLFASSTRCSVINKTSAIRPLSKPTSTVRRTSARLPPRAVQNVHKAREVSAEELEAAIQLNERPMIVDAFARWCGPCQFLIPQLDIVADKFKGRLDILKFDTEMYPKMASALQVKGLPTLFFVKDGKLHYRMEGALTADQLEMIVEYVLFDGPPPNFAPQEPAKA